MQLRDFLPPTIQFYGSLDRVVTGITLDSRTVVPGSMFACLPGTKVDGHAYLDDARTKGAEVFLVSRNWLDAHRHALHPACTYLTYDDANRGFALLAAAFYGDPTKRMKLIGVTGTNGKTTTTHLIEAILKHHGAKPGLVGTNYYRWNDHLEKASHTTPMAHDLQALFKRMADEGVSHVCMEVSSHALHQHRVGGCTYDLALMTNITQDHLDYHGTIDSYRDAKGLLFSDYLAPGAPALFNGDDPESRPLIARFAGNKQLFALENAHADYRAVDITYALDGVRFKAITPHGTVPMHLRLAGQFNVYNALGALAAGRSLGVPLETCVAALEEARSVSGRLEIVTPDGHPFTVLVDYAHTPDGLANILRSTRQFTPGRVIAVFGCGGDRDRRKRPIMGGIAQELADIAIVTSDNPRSEDPAAILAEIVTGMRPDVPQIVDRREAIRHAIRLAKPGDAVVIAGKGHEDYQIFADKTIHFDDREEARAALADQGLIHA
jgi:UDP-N-acetylmuramoyl-L-alanyl-D-glutamate--2,6-diaminopimelate ligase